jgi:N-methylhydantoinase B
MTDKQEATASEPEATATAMSARAKSPAAAARPAPKVRSGAGGPPERSERWGSGSAHGGISTVDPILLEIVQGSLASIEMEVETAIARTSRSPMIRDAHDFRAGIHDRRLR